MKKSLVYFLLLFVTFAKAQQALIHAHNDYAQPEPFINAYRNKVFSIEADVYAGRNNLYVAHDKKDIDSSKTLTAMYLQPIIHLFATHNGHISDDTGYAPVLMIDIKENHAAVIPQLLKLLAHNQNVFDRSINRHAVQVVLSGDRGPAEEWTRWPSYILFDGRPYEAYDSATLKRVAFISDTYTNYAKGNSIAAVEKRLKELADKVHTSGKLLRLWATPDNEKWWARLNALGVDIINTDQVTKCAEFFRGN